MAGRLSSPRTAIAALAVAAALAVPAAASAAPDFGVTISGAPEPADALGGLVTYAVTVTNGGNEPAPFSLYDDLSELTVFDAVRTPSSQCTTPEDLSGGRLACHSNAYLPPGSSVTIELDVRAVNDNGQAVNVATVLPRYDWTGAADPNPANDSARWTTTFGGAPTGDDSTGSRGGGRGGDPGSGSDAPGKPSIAGLAVRPRSFRSGRAARVSYRMSQPARVTFRVERVAKGRRVGGRCVAARAGNRGKRSCTRYVPMHGSLTRDGSSGLNSFGFKGRLGHRALAPGRYRLAAAGAHASFTILKG